uniref:G-patch domain containing 4 n=1 Tax=Phasianus colchicus TaxID=9054 RepID=A0A669QFN9_PHACC
MGPNGALRVSPILGLCACAHPKEGSHAHAQHSLHPLPSATGALYGACAAHAHRAARRGREESVAAMSAAEPLGAGLRFAERQLRRHGWTQGERRHGCRRWTGGVGHDAAEQFSFHWWDHVFNEAAANIAVRDGQVRESLQPLPRGAAPPRSTLYGHFIKVMTWSSGVGGHPAATSFLVTLCPLCPCRLTDEELVRVCGGRTAHKGARHGLTMSAKLARLEEQERAFLAAKQHGGGGQPMAPQSSPPAELQESRKKKKKKKRELLVDGADVEGLQSQEANGGEEEVGEEERRKKKKKKRKEKVEEVVEMEVPPEDTGGPEEAEHHPGVERKKKKKKKRRREAE